MSTLVPREDLKSWFRKLELQPPISFWFIKRPTIRPIDLLYTHEVHLNKNTEDFQFSKYHHQLGLRIPTDISGYTSLWNYTTLHIVCGHSFPRKCDQLGCTHVHVHFSRERQHFKDLCVATYASHWYHQRLNRKRSTTIRRRYLQTVMQPYQTVSFTHRASHKSLFSCGFHLSRTRTNWMISFAKWLGITGTVHRALSSGQRTLLSASMSTIMIESNEREHKHLWMMDAVDYQWWIPKYKYNWCKNELALCWMQSKCYRTRQEVYKYTGNGVHRSCSAS